MAGLGRAYGVICAKSWQGRSDQSVKTHHGKHAKEDFHLDLQTSRRLKEPTLRPRIASAEFGEAFAACTPNRSISNDSMPFAGRFTVNPDHQKRALATFVRVLCVSSVVFGVDARAEDVPDATRNRPVTMVSRATPADASEKVLLQYKLKQGDIVRTRVTHLAKTHTKVDKEEQPSTSRTVSTKTWNVKEVAEDGSMTFDHSVANVDASQQVGIQDEVTYNSEKSKEVPLQFKEVDKKVDQVISTITIRPNGSVVTRTTEDAYARLNLGEIAIQFPEEPVAVGDKWETTREIFVRRDDKTPMRITVREVFKLEKVSAGVAVIDVRNEPLKPIRSPEVEAQVMQQLNNGTIRFDIDAGRLLSKEITWNSTVIGFAGPESMLEYSATLQEEQIN